MEECDSTWGSDSESDEPAAADDGGISDAASPAAEGDRAAGDPEDASPQVKVMRKMREGKGGAEPGHVPPAADIIDGGGTQKDNRAARLCSESSTVAHVSPLLLL